MKCPLLHLSNSLCCILYQLLQFMGKSSSLQSRGTSYYLSPEDKLKREELAIKYLPLCFAGDLSKAVFNSKYRDNASMFDLINVFTEYAKEKSPSEKVEIQRRSGQFADWVVKNKKKFK